MGEFFADAPEEPPQGGGAADDDRVEISAPGARATFADGEIAGATTLAGDTIAYLEDRDIFEEDTRRKGERLRELIFSTQAAFDVRLQLIILDLLQPESIDSHRVMTLKYRHLGRLTDPARETIKFVPKDKIPDGLEEHVLGGPEHRARG